MKSSGDERILLDRSPGETRVAVLRGTDLQDILIERDHRPWWLGALVLARVTAVRPELGAAFLDLGDCEGYLETRRGAAPREGEAMLVEVLAEPHRGKAARVSREISLHGDLVTLTPRQPGHAVSRRITAKTERARLRDLLGEAVPETVGAIVRSAARGRDDRAIRSDAAALVARWRALSAEVETARAPMVMAVSPGPLSQARRLAPGAPVLEGRDGVVFREWDVDTAIAEALERRVVLPRGAVLVIDETEALTAIDVDIAGDRNALTDPVRLAEDVAAAAGRRIRLRQLAGLILIDFPRTRSAEARERLQSGLRAALSTWREEITIHGWTRAGLLEVTVARTGPSLGDAMAHFDPAVRWTPETAALEGLRRLLRESAGVARPVLICAPSVRAALMGALRPAMEDCGRRLGAPVAVRAEPGYDSDRIEIESG